MDLDMNWTNDSILFYFDEIRARTFNNRLIINHSSINYTDNLILTRE